ncbi:MAG: TorF family putative porin [Hyphomicrobium sp.]
MVTLREFIRVCGAASIALIGCSSVAVADGYEYEGKAMEPPKAQREFTYSFNIAGTSEYVFRGLSQTDRDPTLQGGADFGWGSLYLGVWASGLDFGTTGAPNFRDVANAEIDIYGGYAPSWDTKTFLGKIDFDFGVIYYWYPNARDAGAELDYVEFKAGYTSQLWSFLIPGLSSGTTVFYSPEYSGEIGAVWTVESTYTWQGREIRGIKPTLSALLGWQKGEDSALYNEGIDDEYYYWNAGLTLGIEKLSFDFRYWDTDLNKGGLCEPAGTAPPRLFQCDETFVFTVKVEVP